MPALAQPSLLRGKVTDESGAMVPGARVEIHSASGFLRATKSGNDGSYLFSELAAGEYRLTASAPNLGMRRAAQVSLGRIPLTVNLVLYVAAERQEVTVEAV